MWLISPPGFGKAKFFGEVYREAQLARLFPVDSTQFDWRRADQLPNIFSEIVETMDIADVEGPIEAGKRLPPYPASTKNVVVQSRL